MKKKWSNSFLLCISLVLLTGSSLINGEYFTANIALVNANESAQQGAVAYWKCDDGSGTVASDSSGNDHDGTLVSTTWTSDVPPTSYDNPSALQFDGADDYVFVPDASELRISNNFTLAFWFKSGSTTQSGKYLLARNSTAASDQIAVIYEYTEDVIEFYVQGYSGENPRSGSQLPLADTEWHHIAYTYDGTTWAGYVDGVQKFAVSRSFLLPTDALDGWYIGAASTITSGRVNGRMDDVRIYLHALSPIEIQILTASDAVYLPLVLK